MGWVVWRKVRLCIFIVFFLRSRFFNLIFFLPLVKNKINIYFNRHVNPALTDTFNVSMIRAKLLIITFIFLSWDFWAKKIDGFERIFRPFLHSQFKFCNELIWNVWFLQFKESGKVFIGFKMYSKGKVQLSSALLLF